MNGKIPELVLKVDHADVEPAIHVIIDAAAELAFRVAAVSGARRAESASLRWTDVTDAHLLTLARRRGVRLVTFDAGIVHLADGRDVELLTA